MAKQTRSKRKPKGLGDVIENITEATGIKKVVETFTEGKDCGCDKRKEKLNKLFLKDAVGESLEKFILFIVDIIIMPFGLISFDNTSQKYDTFFTCSNNSNAKRDASCSATFLLRAVAVVRILSFGSRTPIVKIRSCGGPTTLISL